ncbi:Ammonia channel [Acaryochloris thomasi RCC1774]|uniref:Ammonium transporter n=1 Tax=Acaryochloris thomasi RCC1774 TaxID=1764569 RepID=A0A2W1K3J8_9CYAN|nr:Ammonia channel [Acaryochloris thomasi RCC1774]
MLRPQVSHPLFRYRYWAIAFLTLLLCCLGTLDADRLAAIAQEPGFAQRLRSLEIAQQTYQVNLNTVWVLLTGALVFFMNAGFAILESGLCRSKNSISLLAKNLIIFCFSTVAFWAIGFGIMFGDGNDWIGLTGSFLQSPAENSPTVGLNYRGAFDSLSDAQLPLSAKFFFQLTFAGVAATIVSGIVAERVKFSAFLIFASFLVSFSYPITGHWVWGNGWLAKLGFWDFAGSTVVHAVGGCAGFVGTLMLGPRVGKYKEISQAEFDVLPPRIKMLPWFREADESLKQILPVPAQNLGFATLGCFILWLGWFGFNAGSTLEANGGAVAHIVVNTMMAGAAGGLGAMLTSALYLSKPSLAFMINGILGGCVSITAGCAYVAIEFAAIIGFCGGIITILTMVWLDRLCVDDPVGGIPVHLCGGVWGTLAVGLFSEGPLAYPEYGITEGPGLGLLLGGGFASFGAQCLGVVAICGFTLLSSWIAWSLVAKLLNNTLRVSMTQELKGLDDAFDDPL